MCYISQKISKGYMYAIYRITYCGGSGRLGVHGCKKKRLQDTCSHRLDDGGFFADDCLFTDIFDYEDKASQAGRNLNTV